MTKGVKVMNLKSVLEAKTAEELDRIVFDTVFILRGAKTANLNYLEIAAMHERVGRRDLGSLIRIADRQRKRLQGGV